MLDNINDINDVLAIVITHKICPICGRIVTDDDDITLYNILQNPQTNTNIKLVELICTKEEAEHLDDSIVGISENACKECLKYKNNVIYFIVFDPNSVDEMCKNRIIVAMDKKFLSIEQNNIDIHTTKNGVKYVIIDYGTLYEILLSGLP